MPESSTNCPHPLSSPLLDTRDREAILARLFVDQPPGIIVDCGASTGNFTAAYLTLFPSATILAFEPHPHTADHLRSRFRAEPRVVIEQTAVGAAAGVANFHMHRLPYTSSLLPRPTGGRRYFPLMDGVEDRIAVPVTTLDEYCRRHAIERIAVLKMDIQGAELAALRGAEALLRDHRIDAIFTETFFVPHYEGGCLSRTVGASRHAWLRPVHPVSQPRRPQRPTSTRRRDLHQSGAAGHRRRWRPR